VEARLQRVARVVLLRVLKAIDCVIISILIDMQEGNLHNCVGNDERVLLYRLLEGDRVLEASDDGREDF
jgi:hypothetical protein